MKEEKHHRKETLKIIQPRESLNGVVDIVKSHVAETYGVHNGEIKPLSYSIVSSFTAMMRLIRAHCLSTLWL
jgi:hypothetical protein